MPEKLKYIPREINKELLWEQFNIKQPKERTAHSQAQLLEHICKQVSNVLKEEVNRFNTRRLLHELVIVTQQAPKILN
jgi:hypothetical protein